MHHSWYSLCWSALLFFSSVGQHLVVFHMAKTKWSIWVGKYFAKKGVRSIISLINSPDSPSQGWVRQAAVPGGGSLLFSWLAHPPTHLVVVFHNCWRYWLRVFCRGGLAVPWRFHVWRRWDWVRGGMAGAGQKCVLSSIHLCVGEGYSTHLCVGEGERCAQDWSWRREEFCCLLPGSLLLSPATSMSTHFISLLMTSYTHLLLYTVEYRRLLLSDVIWGNVTSLHPGVLYAPPGERSLMFQEIYSCILLGWSFNFPGNLFVYSIELISLW